MAANETAIRKRQQIASANRTMFIWVVAASVAVGVALVVSIFLFNKLIFTEKVIAKKQQTSTTLTKNLDAIEKLKDQIRVLNTNSALKSVMNSDESDPIQVILDALPSSANSAALGASLQQNLLAQPGITINSVSVNSPQGDNAGAEGDDSNTGAADTSITNNIITFNFNVTGTDAQAIENLLQTLEKSIRTINLTNITLSYQDNGIQLQAEGQAYYQPATTTNLGSEIVKP